MPPMRVTMAALWLPLLLARPLGAFASPEAIVFNRDIRPILSDKCFLCHGPDTKQRKSGLRLDQRDSATQKSKSGLVPIQPGKVEQSELIRRISTFDEDDRMPPAEAHRPLAAEEIALLGRWIREGAPYQPHWAFMPPVRPEAPRVANPSWPANAIDHFVLARLEKETLVPSPAADPLTLIRRVTLDLTGLPPTPNEVAAFLADKSAQAYERLVDRLLASPRYGEHMARSWLDAARYADTNGFNNDADRSMWP